MELLLLNFLAGFILLVIGGILYYRDRENKAFIILIVIGILDVVITAIRLAIK